jgi:hypothetical protein
MTTPHSITERSLVLASNLTLLCRYHHRIFGKRGWQCPMIDGMPWWLPPPWRDPGATPTRNPNRTTE